MVQGLRNVGVSDYLGFRVLCLLIHDNTLLIRFYYICRVRIYIYILYMYIIYAHTFLRARACVCVGCVCGLAV